VLCSRGLERQRRALGTWTTWLRIDNGRRLFTGWFWGENRGQRRILRLYTAYVTATLVID
jgi:hypothetical protein